MARGSKKPIEVEVLKHDAARRENIPTAGVDGVGCGSPGGAGGAARGSGA